MRHQVFGRKLHRNKKEREQLFKMLISDFVRRGKLTSTRAKVKAVRGEIEKLITKSKTNDNLARRYLLQRLNNSGVVDVLLSWGQVFKDRPGGYTRLIKIGNGLGDNREQATLLLVEEIKPALAVVKTVNNKEERPETKKPEKAKGVVKKKAAKS